MKIVKNLSIIFIALIIAVLALARLMLPSPLLHQVVTATNIILVFGAAALAFLSLNKIMKSSHPEFDVAKLKIGWNLITLTLLFYALFEIAPYITSLDRVVLVENIKLFYYVMLLFGLAYFYNSIKSAKTKKGV